MKNSMINKMKNSKFGKFLRRIVGEESGQAMMEYVIIAVLVAAACTAAIIYFGRQNANQIAVAIKAVAGDASGALKQQEDGQKDATTNADDAKKQAEKFGNTKQQ